MSAALWIALLAAAVVVLTLVLWSARRHRNPKLKLETDGRIDELLPSLAGLSLGTLLPGNRVELLQNGHFFDVLIERIGQARRTVHFETFLWKPGTLSRRVAEALAERARAGLKVRVLLDAVGGRHMSKEERELLEGAGARVVFFHRFTLYNIGVLTDRDHRKIAVLDGREAFVGGHCVTDDWLGDAEDGRHTGDLSLRLHGPIVHTLQSVFSENWVGETGEMFVGEDVFPPLEPAGEVTIHAAFVKPESTAPAVKILHHAVLCMARERIWIQNPYFLPEPEAIDALGKAVRRGVDVRVLMPSTRGTDNPLVQHASHRNFEKLLRCGVRLIEYPHTLLHQKALTVDGTWCAVGSTNFDDRSFDTNDEVTLGLLDPALARELDALFEKYAARGNEIRLEEWQRRGAWHKLVDNAAYLVNEVL